MCAALQYGLSRAQGCRLWFFVATDCPPSTNLTWLQRECQLIPPPGRWHHLWGHQRQPAIHPGHHLVNFSLSVFDAARDVCCTVPPGNVACLLCDTERCMWSVLLPVLILSCLHLHCLACLKELAWTKRLKSSVFLNHCLLNTCIFYILHNCINMFSPVFLPITLSNNPCSL